MSGKCKRDKACARWARTKRNKLMTKLIYIKIYIEGVSSTILTQFIYNTQCSGAPYLYFFYLHIKLQGLRALLLQSAQFGRFSATHRSTISISLPNNELIFFQVESPKTNIFTVSAKITPLFQCGALHYYNTSQSLFLSTSAAGVTVQVSCSPSAYQQENGSIIESMPHHRISAINESTPQCYWK